MKTTEINFSKSIKVSVDIQDLADIGWELSDELQMKETHHIDIVVDDDGKTRWCLTNTQKEQSGIWEGSDLRATGDDEQTIRDLEELYGKGKLFNIRTDYRAIPKFYETTTEKTFKTELEANQFAQANSYTDEPANVYYNERDNAFRVSNDGPGIGDLRIGRYHHGRKTYDAPIA